MINIENYLRLNIVDVIMVLVSTLLIVVIAKKFFWNILKDYLDKRQKFIQDQLDEAEKKKIQGAAYCEESKRQLEKIKGQSGQILERSQEMARREADEVIRKAKESAEQMKKKAALEIEQEKHAAQKQMRREIGETAVAVAEQILGRELNEKDHHGYVQDFIKEAGESGWQA